MTIIFNYLFYYLEKENITFDKTEFSFQIQSHPDYPSILAIADALTFFNIQNGIVRVEASEIEVLPDRFVALLKEENNPSALYFVEKRGAVYYYSKNNKATEMSKSALESRWGGVVLLVEKGTTEPDNTTKKNNLTWVLPALCLMLFLSMLFLLEEKVEIKLFFIFPITGILFSVAALKDLFGTKSALLNSFCNITAATSCDTVVGSSKWKIFEILNFSDLSMVFFGSQFLGLLAFLFRNDTAAYFDIQTIMLLGAVPVLFASVYYQKFVEKKWCPICLVIISIILLELGYVLFLQQTAFVFSAQALLVFGFVFAGVALVWFMLKKVLLQQKELKEFRITGNRFMRNYEIFKNSLVSNDSIALPNSPIVLGNKESDTEITIITSPFCGYCEDAHKILEKILTTNSNDLKIKVFFNTDIDGIAEETKVFFRSLLAVYLEKGATSFLEALHYWFETKNVKDWIKKYELPYNNEEIDSIYRQQNLWCKNNDFNFTPAFFANGYQYPKAYSTESLAFFVNDLIEDKF